MSKHDRELIEAFEEYWAASKYCTRNMVGYSDKKCIAWEAFCAATRLEALQAQPDVVVCPICKDTPDKELCEVCSGCGHLTAEEAAVWLAALTASPPVVEREAVEPVPLEQRVREVMDEGDGFWRACSGCQESVDGCVSTQDYPYSTVFKCQSGGGCGECGGLGAIWDTTDYEDMARFMLEQDRIDASHPVDATPVAQGDEVRTAARLVINLRKGIETDVRTAHSLRGNGSSEAMREDDRDFRHDLKEALDALEATLTKGARDAG